MTLLWLGFRAHHDIVVEVEEELGEGDRVLSEPVRDLVRVLGLAVQHRPDLRRKRWRFDNFPNEKMSNVESNEGNCC